MTSSRALATQYMHESADCPRGMARTNVPPTAERNVAGDSVSLVYPPATSLPRAHRPSSPTVVEAMDHQCGLSVRCSSHLSSAIKSTPQPLPSPLHSTSTQLPSPHSTTPPVSRTEGGEVKRRGKEEEEKGEGEEKEGGEGRPVSPLSAPTSEERRRAPYALTSPSASSRRRSCTPCSLRPRRPRSLFLAKTEPHH